MSKKTITVADSILHSSDRHHLMLLYDNEQERSSTEIDCINQALAGGRYCLYATVDANNQKCLDDLARKIQNYQIQIEKGNLKIVNFMPFYESAARGDLTPFKQLKALVESELQARMTAGKSGKGLLVADAACNLSRNVQFDECVTLESWWQDTYNEWMANKLDITIICAHPSYVLKQEEHQKHKGRISHLHSLTLDVQDFLEDGKNVAENSPKIIRILIAEPDSDIRTIYTRNLKSSLPVHVDTAQTGKECLEKSIFMPESRVSYDLIILDSHLKDSSGLHVAKKIIEENPDQQIVFTSTWDKDTMQSKLRAHSLDPEKYPILQKPFVFSQLLSVIKPAKIQINN